MSRTKYVTLDEVFQKADKALTEIDDARLVIKLLAIKAYGTHQAKEIALLFNTQTRTVYKWVELFRQDGVKGLMDKKKGHRAALLNQEQCEVIGNWIDNGRTPQGDQIHWTLSTLSQYIDQEFGVAIKKSAISIVLKKMRYAIRKPRPTHAQSSPEQREDFKKKLHSF